MLRPLRVLTVLQVPEKRLRLKLPITTIILATTTLTAQNHYATLVLHGFLVLQRQIKKEQEVKEEGVVCVKSLV